MPKSQSSANSIKSRPLSGNNLQSPTQQRLRPSSDIASSKPTSNHHSFARITILGVFIIAVADVLFVWHSINASIGVGIGEGGTEPHHVGAEAGLHHLHEKKRIEKLNEHMNTIHTRVETTSKENMNMNIMHKKNNTKQQQMKVPDDDAKIQPNTKNKPRIDPHIAHILKQAEVEVDDETAAKLPTMADAIELYGEKPIIYGLETCERYRQTVKPEDRMVGPAGIFNTGTNLLFELMKENCNIPQAKNSKTHSEPRKNGMRWHVPWGKHNPVSTHRLQHTAKMWGEGINHTAFFPVTMIKDPYGWMGSQCRHRYTTRWAHGPGNCPNLINKKKIRKDGMDVPEKVNVIFAKGMVAYESLIDMWNKWYEDWEAQTFPHITTRFEDLLFHGEEVTKLTCECVGGVFKSKNFKYTAESAKENGMSIHKGAYGLVKAMIQYGNAEKRLDGMTDRDQLYANKALNAELMKRYGYSYPPLPT